VLSPEATLGAAADLVSNGETRLSNALSIAGSIDSETSFTKEKLSIVSALGNDASELIGNVGRKINEFVSSVADPQSLSARSGVDVSRFSGLSNNLTSKFNSQISQLGKATPGNLNLDIAQASGRIVDFAKISSSPPSQPYSVAPTPILENNLISRNFSNQINSGYINPVDQTVRNNRLQSADSLLSNITNIPNIRDRNIAGAVSSQYQSKTSSTNPLDKLMRRG
jgi:hypothetical protein